MDNNPYHHQQQRPLPFPAAEREYLQRQQREQQQDNNLQMSRISPMRSTASPVPHSGRDMTDSVRVTIPAVHVPMASPERDDNNSPKITETITIHEEPYFRNFLSLRTLIEFLSVLVAMIPIFVAPHLGAYQRGFFFDDDEIRYPFHEGTVKPWLLYLVCLLLPFLTIVIGEFCRFKVSKTGYGDMEVKYRLWDKGPLVPPMVVSMTRIFVLFIYGLLITKSITDIAKYAVGRLRPHFWDVCNPDVEKIREWASRQGGNCLVSSGSNPKCYITQAYCRNANSTDIKVQYRLRDSRLSFLSGHASIAFYCMFFVIFYLESRLRWMHLRYCKAIIQFGLFLLAALTGMSRISDHKHHWTDVGAGALLGMFVVVITVFFIGDFFNDRRFLRYKLVSMLQKLDWGNGSDEGSQFARLLGNCDGRDPCTLRSLKHITRHHTKKMP